MATGKISKQRIKNIDLRVDSFGALVPSIGLDQINDFLNRNVKDRKLAHLQEEKGDM